MSEPATKRQKRFRKPEHWDDAPAPAPEKVEERDDDPEGLSPTRYGDWTRKGIAIDF